MDLLPENLTPPPAPQPVVVTRFGGRQSPKWMHLLAVILGVGPLYASVFYTGLQSLHTKDYSLNVPGILVEIAVMVSFAIMLIALLAILGERPGDLQLQRGTLKEDLASAVGLTIAIFGIMLFLGMTTLFLQKLNLLPPNSNIPDSNIQMIRSVLKSPLLTFLFLGPVIWGQAAVIEELTRMFVLTRLWHVWPAPAARVASVFAWSALFGLAHIYQGIVGVVGTALIGLVLGDFYRRRGRVLPLMLAHGLYDTIVSLLLIYLVHHPEAMPSAL